MTLYAPRMSASLFVCDLGTTQQRIAQADDASTYRLDVRPLKARWVSNSYREADTLDLTVSFDESGVDPRALRSAEVYFWLGDGGETFVPSDGNQRFIGIVKDIERVFDTTSKVVNIKCLDYTTLFLEARYPTGSFPDYTDTLRSAYGKICRNTGWVDTSSDPPAVVSSVCQPDGSPTLTLVALGNVNLDLPIGNSVPPRLAKLGKMPFQNGTDSWAVWVTCCESQGLITYVKGGVVIVTQATEYFTANDPPLLVYGQNVLTLTERRDLGQVSGKNVCVRSYNGLEGTVSEAYYPPLDSPLARRVTKKKVVASARKAPRAVTLQDCEIIDLQIPCTDQATLDRIAEMIWMARVRQELTGSLTTREMTVSTAGQAAIVNASGEIVAPGRQNYDLLSLSAGDNIQISIGADALDNIQSLPTTSARLAALEARGYSSDLAQYIVSNLAFLTGPGALPSVFLVHMVEVEYDSAQATFQVRIDFVNTIGLDGSSSVNGPDEPLIDGPEIAPVPVVDAGEL